MARLPERRTLARYAIVAAIVVVLGGLLVRQQFFSGGSGQTNAGETVALGMLEPGAPAVGGRAPDFALKTADGKVIRLSDFRGKTIVLNFWATWCGPCREELPDLEQAYRSRQARADLVVLGVDFQETASQVRSFMHDTGVTYPVVIDADGTVTGGYGLPGLPGTFFIDRDGVIRKQALGPVTGDVLPDGIRAADGAASAG